MRRLALTSAGLAFAVFLSYYLLPFSALFPSALFAAAAALLLFLFCRRFPAGRLCALLLLGAAVGLLAFLLHWHLTLRYAGEWDETEQTFSVRVMEPPERYDHYTRLHVQRLEKPRLDLMLYDYGDRVVESLQPGEILTVTVGLRRADLRYGERNDSYVSRDIYLTGTLKALENTGQVRRSIRTVAADLSGKLSDYAQQLFSDDTSVFMRALMLGDKTDFYRDTALYASMRGAGLMHVVAVSGMHIAFLVGVIQLLFGARPASSVAGLMLVWFFVLMTGATPSAVRAGIMQSVLLMAPVFRRENDGITSLAFALALILLVNPFSCASISLQMSFSAMAGMILLAEPLTDLFCRALALRETSPWRKPVAVVAASLAVLATSTPFSVIHFGTFALYAPVSNLLGLWAVSLCFVGGYASVLASLIWEPLGLLFRFPTELLARYLRLLAGGICRLPHHVIVMQRTEMLLWLLSVYLLVLIAWRCRAGPRFRILLPLTLCVVSLTAALWSVRERYRSADGVIAALDVGQGACVAVLSGDTTVLLDCGGTGTLTNAGETAANWLEAAGRNRVDLLILSHLHSDHCSGVPMLLELIPVGEIVLSPDADSDEAMLPEILEAAEKHGTEVKMIREDLVWSRGMLRLRAAAPSDTGTENERCIISLLSIGDYDMLFTGDAPAEAEEQYLKDRDLPDMELLIVGHHGSRTSTGEKLLETIRAEDAIISVGRNNSYHHPNREVLIRLQNSGCHIYRTDRNGTVEVRVNNP